MEKASHYKSVGCWWKRLCRQEGMLLQAAICLPPPSKLYYLLQHLFMTDNNPTNKHLTQPEYLLKVSLSLEWELCIMRLSWWGEVAQYKLTALSSAAAFPPPTPPRPTAGLGFLPPSLEVLDGYSPVPGAWGRPFIFANGKGNWSFICCGKGHWSF